MKRGITTQTRSETQKNKKIKITGLNNKSQYENSIYFESHKNYFDNELLLLNPTKERILSVMIKHGFKSKPFESQLEDPDWENIDEYQFIRGPLRTAILCKKAEIVEKLLAMLKKNNTTIDFSIPAKLHYMDLIEETISDSTEEIFEKLIKSGIFKNLIWDDIIKRACIFNKYKIIVILINNKLITSENFKKEGKLIDHFYVMFCCRYIKEQEKQTYKEFDLILRLIIAFENTVPDDFFSAPTNLKSSFKQNIVDILRSEVEPRVSMWMDYFTEWSEDPKQKRESERKKLHEELGVVWD